MNPSLVFVGRPGVYGRKRIPPKDYDLNSSEVPVEYIDQEHMEYSANKDTWIDLALLYEGGNALKAKAERVLKKRPREDEEVFAARLDRFTYQNIIQTGLGWYGAALFETEPEIFFNDAKGKDKEFYEDFLINCDTLGTNYIDFWRKVFQQLLTFGRAWVLSDLPTPEKGNEPMTLEEERQGGYLDPHVVAFPPLNVINWQLDTNGKLLWVVVRNQQEEQEFLGERVMAYRWYYFDREKYAVYEDIRTAEEQIQIVTGDLSGRMAKRITHGTHALAHVKRVPLRLITLTGGLWIANRAYLLLIDHLNQDNTLAWSLFMSNLAMPIIIGDVDTTNMSYSDQGYLHFPAGTLYEWTEPEGKSFIHSAKRTESLREECFRSMNLQSQGRSMKATPAMQSGRSKFLEMAPARQILSGMGADLRRAMQEVLVDIKDARKDMAMIPDVRGFTFQEDMTTEEVFAVNSVLSIRIPSERFEKYIYKKVAKAWMPGANRDQLEEVYDEIEAGPTMEEREQEEFQQKVKVAKESFKANLALPPGRGGDGESTPSPDNMEKAPEPVEKTLKKYDKKEK